MGTTRYLRAGCVEPLNWIAKNEDTKMRTLAGWACGVVLGGAALGLTGCSGFFVDVKNGTGSGSGSADYVYVVNQTSNTLGEFAVGSGALTAISGSPITLTTNLNASSVAVTRPNTYAYVGGQGQISCYSVGAGGALTGISANSISATANFVSLETSVDGQWLLALDGTTLTVYVYAINATSGLLTTHGAVPFTASGTSGKVTQRAIKQSPNGTLVGVALGPGGDVIFQFNTTTGTLTQSAALGIASGFSDNALLFDSVSANIFIARGGPTTGTGNIALYSVTATGQPVFVSSTVSGNSPYALQMDMTSTYLYAANRADNTVSGYTYSGTTLVPIANSPFSTGLSPAALARDNSGKYVLAVNSGGSSDVILFGFDVVTPGKLNGLASSASGTDPAGAVAIAATH